MVLTGQLLWVLPSLAFVRNVSGFLPPVSGTKLVDTLKTWLERRNHDDAKPIFTSSRVNHDEVEVDEQPYDNSNNNTIDKPISSPWYNLSFSPNKENNLRDVLTTLVWCILGYTVSGVVYRFTDELQDLPLALIGVRDFSAGHNDETSASIGGNVLPLVINMLQYMRCHHPLARSLFFIAPCVIAPIWEELFFRGLMLPWLASYFPVSVAAWLSSLVFALYHISVESVLPLWLMSYCWTGLYLRTRSLGSVMVVHAMWNSRAFFAENLVSLCVVHIECSIIAYYVHAHWFCM